MIICLDFDHTITLDTAFWAGFILMAMAARHQVVICTMRAESHPIDQPFPSLAPVHYTAGKAKRPFLAALGVLPDVFIDDLPIHIDFPEGTKAS